MYNTPLENGDIIPNVENIINPSMLLESDKFGNMLNQLAEDYRYVFVDAPPLGLVSDAEKIGSMCDGAILVIRSGEISKSEVKSSIKQLERSECKILGVVLNRATDAKGKKNKKKYYNGNITKKVFKFIPKSSKINGIVSFISYKFAMRTFLFLILVGISRNN